MTLTSLMRDNVELLKADGTKVPSLKASVQQNKIIMMARQGAGTLTVSSGDIILRKLSTGAEERYRVVDPGFHEGLARIPATYQMTVLRLEESAAGEEISEDRRQRLFLQWEELGVDFVKHDLMNGGYRFVGGPPSTRRLAREWVQMKEREKDTGNFHISVSGPNSRVNVHSTDNSVNSVVNGNVFQELLSALETGAGNNTELEQLKQLVGELSAASDKNSYTKAYQAFIANAANHMTIITPFLPALTNILSSFAS